MTRRSSTRSSKRVSRKSRKSVRKSRKTSRKSRKSSRKSRKSSRKSRKVTRKKMSKKKGGKGGKVLDENEKKILLELCLESCKKNKKCIKICNTPVKKNYRLPHRHDDPTGTGGLPYMPYVISNT